MAVLAATAGPAAASWAIGVGGAATAGAASLAQAHAPTATKSGLGTITVTLTWPATPGATSYVVHRTGGVGSLGGTCAGTVTTTTCTDSPLLTLQTYSYTVTPLRDNWTGAQSAPTTVST